MLYIVATPIGNLEDITTRALSVLGMVDIVLCEDTRVTSKLLKRYAINTKTLSYHHHSSEGVMHNIVSDLQAGKNIAYVSDAGTPGISDPGNKLVAFVLKNAPEIKIEPIPGASAVVVALSVSGFATDQFMFKGFIPHKNKRQKFIQEIQVSDVTCVFYESVHRIEKLLTQMSELMPERQIMVARELTKQFETLYRGTPGEVLSQLQADTVKGEFVVVVEGK